MSTLETIAACLTPSGTGAIAVLAMRGPRAWDTVRSIFRAAKPLPATPEVGAVWFGHAGEGTISDEVVLTVKQTDPAPWLELHCHGGRQVVAWLLQLLRECGLEITSADRFLEIAEPSTAAMTLALSRALTPRTAAILLDQLSGAFDQAIEKIRRGELLADHVLQWEMLGLRLTAPWRVVVAGPPNAGKSSLVNALAGYQRSIVTAVAGTTRDVVSTSLAVDGWPVELSDTAGLQDSASELEQTGIERAHAAMRAADLVLWVFDATLDQPAEPDRAAYAPSKPILIANKCDLPTARDHAADVRISALTGEGITSLCAAISRRLVPNPPPPGAAVPFLPAQVELLRELAAPSRRAWP